MTWNRSSGWIIVLFYISVLKRGQSPCICIGKANQTKPKEIRPECKIGLEPGRPKGGCWREEEGLCDHRDLHEVAEVQHEEVVVDRAVRRVSQQHQQCQSDLHQVFWMASKYEKH